MTPRAARIGLALLAVAVTLGLLEAATALRYRRRAVQALAGRSAEELETEAAGPVLLYRLKPGLPGVTNSHGFRDLERSRIKPPGVFRVAVIGDSVSMQREIPFDDLWVRRLERNLAPRFGEGRVEVLNFGVTGYSTSQQVRLLESEVLAFEPDALLWQFHHNDAKDPTIDGGDGGLGWYYARPRSYLAQFVRRRWTHLRRRRLARQSGLPEALGELGEQLQSWDRMGRDLGRAASLAETAGARRFCFVVPVWPAGEDWSVYSDAALDLHRELIERFERLGFATLDLLPELRSAAPARYRAAPNDRWHPSREGHRWLADRLAQWLAPQLEPLVNGAP